MYKMPLLSISIDLSRSTKAKSYISKVCKDPQIKNESLSEYYKHLVIIEKEFYIECYLKGIDIKRIFHVKNIGDEFWILYEIVDIEADKKSILVIIKILQHIVSRIQRLFISERKVEWVEAKSDLSIWKNINFEEIFMPIKCFTDLLFDFDNLISLRQESISNFLLDTYNKETKKTGIDHDEQIRQNILDYAYKLNISFEFDKDDVIFKSGRYDPVGLDVDLFFRCTKFAQPAIVCIGDNLYNALRHSEFSERNVMTLKNQNSETGFSYEKLYYIKKVVSQSDLKGILKDYALYYLPDSSSYFLTKDTRHDDGCDETRKLLLQKDFIVPSEDKIQYKINKNVWAI